MSERCNIPLDGPSALHSALAEDGLLEEHIKVQHPEAQQVFSALAAPVLTAEEIAHVLKHLGAGCARATCRLGPPGDCYERTTYVLRSPAEFIGEVFTPRLLATFAAKDRVIAELRSSCIAIALQPPTFTEFEDVIKSLRQQIAEYREMLADAQSKFHDANRRASDLFDELGATQVCPLHDEPRGECSECPPCPLCVEQTGGIVKEK